MERVYDQLRTGYQAEAHLVPGQQHQAGHHALSQHGATCQQVFIVNSHMECLLQIFIKKLACPELYLKRLANWKI